MPIPDFQSTMLPLLKRLSDGKVHSMTDLTQALADEFSLSEAERVELLPSGVQRIFSNRLWFARTFLKKAGLLSSPGRGLVSITARGQQTLEEKPAVINNKYLSRFPEFREFRRVVPKQDEMKNDVGDDEKTPRELIEEGANAIHIELVAEVLNHLRKGSPEFFERTVVDVLLKMGYGGSRKDAGQAIGKTGDGGIDGIIKEDKLGLDVIYIQAKRWESNVGSPAVRTFVGSLEGVRAQRGIILTTSEFSKDAVSYAAGISRKIVLIGGEQLANLMIEHGVGVTTEQSYAIKRLDTDYFEED